MLSQTGHFPTVTPAEAGVDANGILRFLDACQERKINLHGLLLLREGKAVAEGYFSPYCREDKMHLFSISKSWTSTAVGFAVQEGLLSIHDKVASFFPDKLPDPVPENLAAMEVRDLLRMGTGNDKDTLPAMRLEPDGDWVKIFLHCPVEHRPGTKFVYNSGASYLLSAIVQKVSGQDLIAFLTPRLFEPLRITGVTWDRSPQGICCGGWGIHVSTEDLAKLGQLYLNGGIFDGKRLLSEEWVKEATSAQIDNSPSNTAPDWICGYGYQIWWCQHGCYRFDGAYGQYMVAIPKFHAVLALTSFVGSMQEVLDLIWENLLPAFHDAPLPASEADQKLSERLKHLSCFTPDGVGRIFSAAYACEDNEYGFTGVSVSTSEQGGELIFTAENASWRIPFGAPAYRLGNIDGFPVPNNMIAAGVREPAMKGEPIGASAAWDGDTLHLRMVYRATPHYLDFHLDTAAPSLNFCFPCPNFVGNDRNTTIALTLR